MITEKGIEAAPRQFNALKQSNDYFTNKFVDQGWSLEASFTPFLLLGFAPRRLLPIVH
jgi:hypothetical protein